MHPHARRWRRRQPAAWQVVLARWLLALAVIALLSPSVDGPYGIARAQDRTEADDPLVERNPAPDERRPEREAPQDGIATSSTPAPVLTPAHPDEPLIPIFQPRARDDRAPPLPPPPPAPPPDPSTGNLRPVGRRPMHTPASCPADQGVLKGSSFGRDDRLVMTYYYYWYDQAS